MLTFRFDKEEGKLVIRMDQSMKTRLLHYLHRLNTYPKEVDAERRQQLLFASGARGWAHSFGWFTVQGPTTNSVYAASQEVERFLIEYNKAHAKELVNLIAQTHDLRKPDRVRRAIRKHVYETLKPLPSRDKVSVWHPRQNGANGLKTASTGYLHLLERRVNSKFHRV